MAGGMHGWGACVVGVHGNGACMGGIHVWRGGMRDTHPSPGRYHGYSIWSMSGQYASYWNAFLFGDCFVAELPVSRSDFNSNSDRT